MLQAVESNTLCMEVNELAALLASADGGCKYCAAKLANKMTDIDAHHDWFALIGKAGGWTVEKLREALDS